MGKKLAAVRAEKQRQERAISALADEMKDLGEPLRFLRYLRRAWDEALAQTSPNVPKRHRNVVRMSSKRQRNVRRKSA